jgi:hypothetical protein
VPPAAREVLARFDERSQHYEIKESLDLEDAGTWIPYMTPLTNTPPIRRPGPAPREPAELSLAYIRVGKTRAGVAVSFAGSPRSAEKPAPRKSAARAVPRRC